MGFKFWTSWGPDAKIQKHYGRVYFFKTILKVDLKISPLFRRHFFSKKYQFFVPDPTVFLRGTLKTYVVGFRRAELWIYP